MSTLFAQLLGGIAGHPVWLSVYSSIGWNRRPVARVAFKMSVYIARIIMIKFYTPSVLFFKYHRI